MACILSLVFIGTMFEYIGILVVLLSFSVGSYKPTSYVCCSLSGYGLYKLYIINLKTITFDHNNKLGMENEKVF